MLRGLMFQLWVKITSRQSKRVGPDQWSRSIALHPGETIRFVGDDEGDDDEDDDDDDDEDDDYDDED